MVCGGLLRFACISLVSLHIVINSGGDLLWFAKIYGGLWSFAVDCDGLSFTSHTPTGLRSPPPTPTLEPVSTSGAK